MDIQKFLEEFKGIDLEQLDREQQENFRSILFNNGLFEDALELSRIIYEQNKEEDDAIEGYVHNLMYLNKKDDALFILYNAEKTAPVLYLEGMIYKNDGLLEIAEDKFQQARSKTKHPEAVRSIDSELVSIYLETGRENKAKIMSERIFHEEPSAESFHLAFDNLFVMGLFEDAVDFYTRHGREYEDANLLFAVAYSYNQLKDIENSKMYLLKTIDLDSEFVDSYLHLGHMSKGEEAKKYLEKYIELQGVAHSAYLHLISLYNDDKEYDKIRQLMKEVLTNMGISEETLYIAIYALKTLFEYDKIYSLYNEHAIVKDDPILLGAALNALSEEEDYIDFVEEEAVTYVELLHDEPTYLETLKNVYELTGSKRVHEIIEHFEHHHHHGCSHNHHDEY
ncbi:tetratricopeptide repeat protein [Gemella massiliensis]|uniref:tetratricopeptide repeat protein n=1 Tax=Gemella massiliensis TaxID=1909670 RepID=UPI000931FC9D|nr:hypothetical protein [Gemella massiliensis]